MVWFEPRIALAMTAEASRAFPRETGGILIGYGDERSSQSVVRACIGPGPRAVHGRSHFLPDHAYHEREVARLYAESGRVWSYLGDWHTHPCGGASLSWKDRHTLARIARSAEARAPRPLMVLLAGAPADEGCSRHEDSDDVVRSRLDAALFDGWQMVAWQLLKRPSRFDAMFARVEPTAARVQLFTHRDPSYQASVRRRTADA